MKTTCIRLAPDGAGRWSRGCGTAEAEVRDDRVRTALQGDEEFERITVLLPRGAEDARHDVLGGGAPARSGCRHS